MEVRGAPEAEHVAPSASLHFGTRVDRRRRQGGWAAEALTPPAIGAIRRQRRRRSDVRHFDVSTCSRARGRRPGNSGRPALGCGRGKRRTRETQEGFAADGGRRRNRLALHASARRRRQPASTAGPRPRQDRRSRKDRAWEREAATKQRTNPPFSCAAPARNERATRNTRTRRCRVGCNGGLGSATGHARGE